MKNQDKRRQPINEIWRAITYWLTNRRQSESLNSRLIKKNMNCTFSYCILVWFTSNLEIDIKIKGVEFKTEHSKKFFSQILIQTMIEKWNKIAFINQFD